MLRIDDRQGQALFGVEVEVDGSLRHSGGDRDLAQGRAGIPMFLELGCGSPEDRGSGFHRPRLLHHMVPQCDRLESSLAFGVWHPSVGASAGKRQAGDG
jgi:hypothetical protein